ncbi:MAG TPA: hypothetical protein VF085_02140 [Solirubrobacterales bacterium]
MERPIVPDREPFDPLAGLRAMADAQRRGLETAAAVVERMLELSRQSARGQFPFPLPAEPVDGSNGDGADATGDPGREVRRLRADAERLLELLGESVRVLFDLAADAAEAGVDGQNGIADELLLGPAAPGTPAVGRVWLHVLDGPPGAPARLNATAFTAHDGAAIEARAASFEPPLLDTFALRSSQEVLIAVQVPEAATPGVYHGHILAAGLPEVGLPVRIEVAG